VALRSIVRDQAQAAIRGQVEIGDVDLWLLRGAISLDGVAIRPAPEAEPVLSWDQLYVQISWPELARRTLLLREIDLVHPRVDVERLADGGINLTRLLPEPAPQPEVPQPASEWRVALEKLVIDRGQVRFQDASVKGAKPIHIDIGSLQAAGGGFAGAIFEGRSTIAARLEVEGAPLQIDGPNLRAVLGTRSQNQIRRSQTTFAGGGYLSRPEGARGSREPDRAARWGRQAFAGSW